MKRTSFALSLLLVFAGGCGESAPPVPEPDQFAISYLEASHGLNFEAAYEYLSKEDQAYISKTDYVEYNFPSDLFEGWGGGIVSWRKLISAQTTYTIEEKDIFESRANVVIRVSAPDYTKFIGDIFTQAFSQTFDNKADSPDNNELLESLADKQDVPKTTTKIELELRLEDGYWRVFENVKLNYEKAKTTEKIDELLKKASNFREKKKFTESINTYKEVLEIDETNSKAKKALNKIEDEIKEAEFKQAYIENIEIFEFEAKRIDTYSNKNVPAVRFALKNKGDRSLDKVEVTVYFYDNSNQPIYERTFTPVLVSEYSFSNNSPLKPNYIWREESNNYYTLKQLGPEWSGRAKATISDIRFSEE